MSGIVHHLVSRGVEETHQRLKNLEHEGKPQPISPWKATSLVITVIVYMLAMFAVRSTSFFDYPARHGCNANGTSRSSTHTAT